MFCFFSSIYVQFSRTSPLKSGESSEKSSGENRVKSCHVCGCHVFFVPEISGSRYRRLSREQGLKRGEKQVNVVDVSDFFFFSARGRGRGSPRWQEGAGVGSHEGGGGVLPGERPGGEGEGPEGCLWGLWGC